MLDAFPEHLPLVRRGVVRQGYISTRPVVRIRVTEWENGGTDYVLCFKNGGGLVRQEVELPLDKEQFEQLRALLRGPLIRKDYAVYRLPDGHLLECSVVDAGTPTSFACAEIEFDTEQQARAYPAPDCVGPDVTGKGYGMARYWERTRTGLDESCQAVYDI